MDLQVVAWVAAGIGVLATSVYIVLGLMGVKRLREIRDLLRRTRNSN